MSRISLISRLGHCVLFRVWSDFLHRMVAFIVSLIVRKFEIDFVKFCDYLLRGHRIHCRQNFEWRWIFNGSQLRKIVLESFICFSQLIHFIDFN